MREVLSFIFDRIIDPLSLPIDTWKEWLILGIIEIAAYIIAYRCVGSLYQSGNIDGKTIGSIIHWIIRLLVFIVIWAITYSIIWIVKFITTHLVIVLSILVGIIVITAISYLIVRVTKKYDRPSFPK